MTIPDQILCDLLISQSTADSIAGRIVSQTPVHKDEVTAYLRRLAVDGHVESGTIAGTLLVWFLTESGHLKARELKPNHRVLTYPNPPAVPV
jgi:hypothetical protein